MKSLKIPAFVLALVACAPLAAFAQSVAGDWELTIETPQGTNTLNVSLTQNGDAVTGTLSSPMGSVPMKGTATGSDVNLAADIDVQGMTLSLTFTGKATADSFNGTVKFGDFGEGPFTGKRAAAPAASAASAPAATPVAATVPAAPAAGGEAGSASGKWDITLNLQGAGEFPMSAAFSQDGDKISGTLSSQAGDVPVSGTMSGNSLNLKFTAQTPQGEIPVTMTGTLSNGTFTGTAAIEGLGQADWTGKRAQQ